MSKEVNERLYRGMIFIPIAKIRTCPERMKMNMYWSILPCQKVCFYSIEFTLVMFFSFFKRQLEIEFK